MDELEGLFPVGLRYAAIIGLNSGGSINATSGSPFSGLELEGAKTFAVNEGDPELKTFTGRDGVQSSLYLGTKQATDVTLNSSDVRLDIQALTTGTKVRTIGSAKQIVKDSDQSGKNPDVAVHLYQQANDALSGETIWRSLIFPKAMIVPKSPGGSDNPEDSVYKIAPKKVSKTLLGEALSLITDGATKAGYFELITKDRPRIVAWKAPTSGSNQEFPFETGYEAKTTAQIDQVTAGGSVISGSANITLATDKITIKATLAAGDIVQAIYETV